MSKPGSSWQAVDLSKLPTEEELSHIALNGVRYIHDQFRLSKPDSSASGADIAESLFELMSSIGLKVA